MQDEYQVDHQPTDQQEVVCKLFVSTTQSDGSQPKNTQYFSKLANQEHATIIFLVYRKDDPDLCFGILAPWF